MNIIVMLFFVFVLGAVVIGVTSVKGVFENQKGGNSSIESVASSKPKLTTTPVPGENSPNEADVISEGKHHCSILDYKTTYLRTSTPGAKCPSGQEKHGFLCYRGCPDGWTQNDAFPNTCGRCRDYSSTCDYLSMIYTNKVKTGVATECGPGYDKWSGLCYKLCKTGYKAQGNICIKCKN